MKIDWKARLRGLSATAALPQHKTLLLFGVEGILYQFSQSVNNFGNCLYATRMGASDTQIGLVQMVPNLLALILLLPCGMLSDRMPKSRTVPSICLLIVGIMYFFYASVPIMGGLKLSLFFVFLGMTVAGCVLYNAQWQNFFGDVTPPENRNPVFTFRSRVMFFIGILTPLLCGFAMAAQHTEAEKIMVLRIFYYICGCLILLQFLIIRKIPCAARPKTEARFSPALIVKSVKAAFSGKYFRRFFLTGVLFYVSWQMDWSMWYIEQTQYAYMNEAHLSITNAVNSIAQMAAIGFFSRLIEKRSVYFTMIIVEVGYLLGTLCALFALSPVFSDEAKPFAFILMAIIPSALECSFNLCLVQMMLASVPLENRSLIISLYTLVITLSNAVIPYFGVQLYRFLGADISAVFKFNGIIVLMRLASLVEIIWLFFTTKKEGRLFAAEPEPEKI